MTNDPMPQPKSDYTAKDYLDEFYPRRRTKWLRMLAFVVWSLIMVGCTALGLFIIYAIYMGV